MFKICVSLKGTHFIWPVFLKDLKIKDFAAVSFLEAKRRHCKI